MDSVNSATVFQELRSTADHVDDATNASEMESLCLMCRKDVSFLLVSDVLLVSFCFAVL